MLEVVAAAIDVHEHAGERGGQDGGALLVQIVVEIAGERVGEAVREGLEPGLRVVVAGDMGQGLRAVVRDADQDRGAGSRDRMPDDREGLLPHGRIPTRPRGPA
jgi:hypothetical protein